MFTTLVSFTLFSGLFLAQSVLGDFTVTTPTLTQCQPAQFKWDGNTGTVNMAIVPSADPCGDLLADLGDHEKGSMTWTVTIPAGQQVMASLLDDNGDEAWSGSMTVQPSDDSTCLPAVSNAVVSNVTNTPGVSINTVAPTASAAATPNGAVNSGLEPNHSGAISSMRPTSNIVALMISILAIGIAF